jgi:VWFA-related protein
MNIRMSFGAIWVAFLLAGATTSSGQEPVSTGITITSRTRLVQVPVVVSDKSGRHVPGLGKNDFVLIEGGKEKQIASVEEVKTTNTRFSRPAEQRGSYSNALSGDQAPKRLTIFALDVLNTPFLDQSYARAQLLKFLANRLDKQEPTALVSISANGIRVMHDFTTDPAVLVEALQRATGTIPDTKGATDQISTETADLGGFTGGGGGGGPDPYVSLAMRQAITVTLQSFQHVAEAYAGVPGRKSLIWATASFPFGLDPTTGSILSPQLFDPGTVRYGGSGVLDHSGDLPSLPSSTEIRSGDDLKSLEPMYRRTIQMLNDANISIYPVDARGLVVFFPGADVTRIEKLSSYNEALFESSRNTMVGFAEMTGGKAFYNRNDLDVAFAKAAADSANYYMLGYYLDKDTKPGWHKLQVKTKHEGSQVRARNGFFVTPGKDEKDDLRMDVKMALASPLDYTALPITVRWTGLDAAGEKKKLHFRMDFPPSANLVNVGDNNHMSLEIVALARAANSEPADQFSRHLEANFKPDALQSLQRDGLNYSNELQVPHGEYTVRFVVRDNLTGRLGSLTAPVRVKP